MPALTALHVKQKVEGRVSANPLSFSFAQVRMLRLCIAGSQEVSDDTTIHSEKTQELHRGDEEPGDLTGIYPAHLSTQGLLQVHDISIHRRYTFLLLC